MHFSFPKKTSTGRITISTETENQTLRTQGLMTVIACVAFFFASVFRCLTSLPLQLGARTVHSGAHQHPPAWTLLDCCTSFRPPLDLVEKVRGEHVSGSWLPRLRVLAEPGSVAQRIFLLAAQVAQGGFQARGQLPSSGSFSRQQPQLHIPRRC